MLNKLLSKFFRRDAAGNGPKKELVSIIIPTYSRVDLLSKGLELLTRTAKDGTFDYEIVVVDNGSSEGTREKLAALSNKYPEIKLIRNEENLAFSYANEEGVKVSNGDYYCFYNDDVMAVKPDWLKEMLRCMRRHSKAGLVGAKLLYPDGTIQSAGISFHNNGNPFCVHNGERGDHPDTRKERQFQAVSFACVLVKKEAYDRIGGFEKLGRKFEYYAEDFDFCFRAREAGYEVWYCPKAVMIHHCGSTSASEVTKEKTDQYRKRFTEKWKHRIIAEYD